MPSTPDMLAHCAHLPELTLPAGEVLVREGQPAAGLWILVSGSLRVLKGSVPVNVVAQPGAVIGEMSLLLDAPSSATVIASEPCVLRHAADGAALLARDPAITRLIAVGLAERLNVVTTYLADLKHQYGDAPGLAMVSEVVAELAQRPAAPAVTGSARDPDPEY